MKSSGSLQAGILRHWRVLCEEIGERRAGGKGEQAAADYFMREMGRLGLSCHQEYFPCTSLRRSQVEFAIQRNGKFQKLTARALAGAPGTPGKGSHEAGIVWVEMPEQAGRKLNSSIRGKIVFLVGPLPTHADLHRKLMAQKPLAVVHVDDRIPFNWVKNDGVYPAWTRRYGMPPTITIPYMDAWKIRKEGLARARIRVWVDQAMATSQNVIAEIPGTNPKLPVILLGAHHDSQCNNVGADDNASGVVALLELAAKLRNSRFARTIRLVTFGCEEQLSVGSAAYVQQHRRELKNIGAIFNIDSVSSILGHHHYFRAGSGAFGQWLSKKLSSQGFDAIPHADIMPFMDHFAFSVFGIPGASFGRGNMSSGMRWQHHSIHDHLGNVSVEELGRVILSVEHLVRSLANQEHWGFPRGLAPAQVEETLRIARDLYDFDV